MSKKLYTSKSGKIVRETIALLLATTALGVVSAHAIDGTWIGGISNEWSDGSNWTSVPTVPDGIATFSNSGPANVSNYGSVSVGAVQFTADPNAQAFTIDIHSFFGVNTLGIINNSTNTQTFNISSDESSVLIFHNASTASGGTGSIAFTNIGGFIYFYDTSTASNAAITNTGILEFHDTGAAGNAQINNNVLTSFFESASAGSATIANSSTAILGFSNTSTAGSSQITNDGSLQFSNSARAGTSTIASRAGSNIAFYNGSSADSANIQLTGASITFNDTSTAGSATINNNGTVSFFDSSTGGNARFITNAGGTFDQSSLVVLTNTAGSIEGAGNYLLGSKLLTVGSNDLSTTVSGVISGNGGSFAKVGTGTLTLSGVNTYTGGTTINGGTLSVSSDNNLGDASGALTFDGGTLQVTGTAFHSTARNIIWGANGGGFDIADINHTFELSQTQAISGTGGLTKLGAGTLLISGTTDYSGATNVMAGTLQADPFGTLSSTSDFTVAAGATLDLNRSIQFIGSLSGAGNVTNSASDPARLIVGGTSVSTTFSGAITDGPGGPVELWVGGLGTSGTFTLTGANTYTGGTAICSCWALQLGDGGATGSITGDVTNGGTLIFNRSNAYSFGGVISDDHTDLGKVVQAGTGTTTLSGKNTYSGGTMLSQGTIQIGVDSTFTNINDPSTQTSSAIGLGKLTFDGGTLMASAFADRRFGNAVEITANGGTVDNAGGLVRLFGPISDAASSHGGTLTLMSSAPRAFTEGFLLGGVSTYSGATNIASGTVLVESVTALSPNSAFRVNTGATLTLSGYSNTIASLADGIDGGGIVQNGAASGTATLTLSGASGGTTSFSGVLQNGGAGGEGGAGPRLELVKAGGGTQILSGVNTYTGGTTINAGTLQLGNGGASGSIVGDVVNSGTLAFNRSDALTFGGVISGSGNVNQIGGGTTTLTAINTYTGLTTVGAGTLELAAGGAIAGAVRNDASFTTAGTVGGGLTNSATVNANDGAINGAVANNAGTFNVGGTVTGNSTFANASGATLAVNGTGSYTLQGLLTNGGAVNVASGGTLDATAGGITNNAGGVITVAQGSTVRDDLNNAGTVTNNGAYVATVASNTGSITNAATGIWTGNVVSSTGTITNSNLWTGSIANAGLFSNTAGATLSGLLTNSAGVTTNDGALNGGTLVSGGTLRGTGSITNLTIGSGGSFAPGNGTAGSSMRISGNLALQSGAQYVVALDPATASYADVGGRASLGGATVNAIYANGSYVSKRYTILTAAGGVSGVFNGPVINTNLPGNFHSGLSYDPTHAYLDLDLNFAIPNGLNINQNNVATTLTNFFNATGGIPLAFGALSPQGLTQVSGELATGTQQATFDAMNLFLGLLTDPFVAGRGAGEAPSNGALGYAASGNARPVAERDAYAAMARKALPMAPTFDQRWSVWAAGYGGSQTTSGKAVVGSNTATSSLYGTTVGADYRLSPDTLVGFAMAGGATGFRLANGLGSGRSDLFQAGAFIRHTRGPAYLSGALAYGWQDVTTDRTVTAVGIERLRANFNANAVSGRIEAGYRIATPWLGLTPYAAGQFTSYDLPGYAEQSSGGGLFALNYAAKSVTSGRSELGLRTDKSFALNAAILTLRGRAAWAHNFDTDRSIAATFQSLPGATFVVNGAAQAREAALVTGSAEMKWANGFAVAATFEGEFSDTTTSYAGKGVVRYSW